MRRWRLYLALGGLLLLLLVIWQPRLLTGILLGVGVVVTATLKVLGATEHKPGHRPRRGGGGTEPPPTNRSPLTAEEDEPRNNGPVRGPRRGGF